jgi:hypothetical protein
VRAICDSSGNCLVLDTLGTGEATTKAHRMGMLGLLREHIPQHGVPPKPHSGPLGDGMFELRKQPKGPKLRVAFFYDEWDRNIVVCTHAFWKDQRTMPFEIDRAQRLRALYSEARKQRTLRVTPL